MKKISKLCTQNITVYETAEGNLYAEHIVQKSGDYWSEIRLGEGFSTALHNRRKKQAELFVSSQKQLIVMYQPILDYGCGEGLFTRQLRSHGFDVVGCDYSKHQNNEDYPHFLQLQAPWDVLDAGFQSIVLNDVLEHHYDPKEFLASFKNTEVFFIKVPCLSGPSFLIAKWLAYFGFSKALEQLFLVGDVSPHVYYFSRSGLSKLLSQSGFEILAIKSIPEVGVELPFRAQRQHFNLPKGIILFFLGILFEILNWFGWTDSFLVVARRSVLSFDKSLKKDNSQIEFAS